MASVKKHGFVPVKVFTIILVMQSLQTASNFIIPPSPRALLSVIPTSVQIDNSWTIGQGSQLKAVLESHREVGTKTAESINHQKFFPEKINEKQKMGVSCNGKPCKSVEIAYKIQESQTPRIFSPKEIRQQPDAASELRPQRVKRSGLRYEYCPTKHPITDVPPSNPKYVDPNEYCDLGSQKAPQYEVKDIKNETYIIEENPLHQLYARTCMVAECWGSKTPIGHRIKCKTNIIEKSVCLRNKQRDETHDIIVQLAAGCICEIVDDND
ncbi:hypothetical protein QAD02_001833 [Eretmocerus hayati]|uniref:Uncharacterized protein n=1 Tax=Eretmocerus hayati TaxID=131215 RepID=A0ACC2NHH2_9HYME|nr:hypothetical protein QAD02_001833 [Eretmocerus hayati]